MFKKKERLRKKKDFDAMFQGSRNSYDDVCGLRTRANGTTGNKYGVVVGLKVSKLAVERNKIKRQIREILKSENEFIKKGFDIAVIAKGPIRDLDFTQIKRSIRQKLNSNNLYD